MTKTRLLRKLDISKKKKKKKNKKKIITNFDFKTAVKIKKNKKFIL